MITAAGMSAMPVTGCIVHGITGERATEKLSAVLLHVALVTYYSQKKTKHFHGLEKKKGPDLTSHNELVVNGVQWGASLVAVGTVNINTQSSCSHSRGRQYPIEKLSVQI